MRTALLSTYPPRACGIGTLALDLRTSLLAVPGVRSVVVVVVLDDASSPQRPELLATVSQTVRADYVRAARLLGRLDVDVVLLEHEYDSFGGADGEYVLAFARTLSRPLVVAVQTVLPDPSAHQREVLAALCDEAERVIVMTETAKHILVATGACPAEKLRVVPHRAPRGRAGDLEAAPNAIAEVLREAANALPRREPVPVVDLELATVRTDHLRTLIDDVGIIQHANGLIPNWDTGYCVDDVSRLAVVALGLSGHPSDPEWTRVLHRSLAFLQFATGPPGTGMRNFMAYDRRWLDEPHVGDHVGRTVVALGEILSTEWVPALFGPARSLLGTLVPSLEGALPIRTAAFTVLGLGRLDPERLDRDAQLLLERLVDELAAAYRRTASASWSWFEDRLAYDNARLAHALIVGGSALKRPADVALGLEALAWLGDQCGLDTGCLRLPGHRGRGRDEPPPGPGDEQPLDAAALVEAELSALALTGDPEHGARAQQAFDWFLGRNRLGRPLYDAATGGCRDGLGETDLNANEGAESTLAFHRAQLLIEAAALPAVTRVGGGRGKVA